MPDFDIDFCEKKETDFEYLKNKYKNGVAHIITFGNWQNGFEGYWSCLRIVLWTR